MITVVVNSRFASFPPTLSFRPGVSTYNFYGPESAPDVKSIPPVDFYTLSPNLAASIRAGSGRMIPMGPVGISYYDGETIATVFVDTNGNVSRCELLEVK